MRAPAMTPAELADRPEALVRVGCRACGVSLYAGDVDPPGGAAAVWAAAGCPPLGAPDGDVAACPNRPPSLEELADA